jgi:hypothetical protein
LLRIYLGQPQGLELRAAAHCPGSNLGAGGTCILLSERCHSTQIAIKMSVWARHPPRHDKGGPPLSTVSIKKGERDLKCRPGIPTQFSYLYEKPAQCSRTALNQDVVSVRKNVH